ncbi:MAG: hypothetical protein L0Z55_06200, partial [Planctomycetes bacterium]|nr:hypothetical protein [Planctomycetota bacterium]
MVMQAYDTPRASRRIRTAGRLPAAALILAFLFAASCLRFSGRPDVAVEDAPAAAEFAAARSPTAASARAPLAAAAPDTGCISCHHNATDPHQTERVSCVGCHGGDGAATAKEAAHPEPHYKKKWPTSANPPRSYMLTIEEDIAWIRFVNPGDLRVAEETCGGCHANIRLNVAKSVMTTSAPFWGVAAYANGIVSSKFTIFGESYARDGTPQKVNAVPAPTAAEQVAQSIVPFLIPLPHFEISHTGNIYRVFEQGSRLGTAGLGLNGANSPPIGIPDKLEDGGKPNNRLSDRGFGTLNRVDLPLLNVHKTRLNDPHLSFMGTNDNPGDYRSSGCTACHMVYANDRSVYASGPYAVAGNRGRTLTDDPTIPKDESGHPIRHKFAIGIPSSQCMTCHHHQPNSFVNSFFGFTMWNYESDGQAMWPLEERDPSNAEMFEIIDRNPEAAAQRSLWGDYDFLAESSAQNASNKHTIFADYHGHGWIFRGAFKKDRKGNLLDAAGAVIPYDTPSKFAGVLPLAKEAAALPKSVELPLQDKPGKPVLLQDVHAEVGMHCVDCHFEQDVHGNGKLYAEYQAAVEIRCQDCHGTATEFASLRTSGPAAPEGGRNLREMKTSWHPRRFEEMNDGRIVQRSMLHEGKEWVISQVADSVDPKHPDYNAEAAYAKRVAKGGGFDPHGAVDPAKLAHGDDRMECYSCHSSWVTACFGCHLPQQANWRTEQHHFEDY